jgi:hypothetical protein
MAINKVCLVIDLTLSPAPSLEEFLQFLSSSREVLQEFDLFDRTVVICLPSPHSNPEELTLISSLKSKTLELEMAWIPSLAAFTSSALPSAPLLSSATTAMIKKPNSLFSSSSLMNLPVLSTLLLGCVMAALLQKRGGWPSVLTLDVQQLMASLAKWSAKFRKLYS